MHAVLGNDSLVRKCGRLHTDNGSLICSGDARVAGREQFTDRLLLGFRQRRHQPFRHRLDSRRIGCWRSEHGMGLGALRLADIAYF